MTTPNTSRGAQFFYGFILLAITSADYVVYIRWMQTMKPYKWYAGSFAFPVFGALCFWIPVWIRRLLCRSRIQKQDQQLPQRHLARIGCFDALNSILGTYATPYLSVILMTVLDKVGLPLTMIASILYLGTRYTKTHYLGGFLTLYGVMVSFIPNFDKGDQVKNPYWLAIYLFSLVPAVASYCYKQRHLQGTTLDIWWMNAWISIWQIGVGLLTFPVLFAPLPTGDNVHGSDVGRYLLDATKCQFAGINASPTDNCGDALVLFVMYQFISTVANILMFTIIRRWSSTVYIIMNTMKMPITAWLGSYPSLVGSQASPIGPADAFSFVMIAVGVAVYNWEPEVKQPTKSDELLLPKTCSLVTKNLRKPRFNRNSLANPLIK